MKDAERTRPDLPKGPDAQHCLDGMRALRESYLDKVRELERKRKPGEGIFGMKDGPANDPCHERYLDELGALLESFLAAGPDSGDTRPVLEALYAVPEKGIPESAYWMLIAVHGLWPELIERLDAADAGALAERYAASYRPWERLPVQRDILKALKRRARA